LKQQRARGGTACGPGTLRHPRSFGKEEPRLVWAASLGRFLFPAVGHRVWRYALPLLLVAALGIWWIQGRLTEDVDVHELLLSQSLVTSSYPLNDPVDSNLVYLIQHAAEQPWLSMGMRRP